MPHTQENREAGITTPLGEDVLLLRDMSMTEELGRLFTIDLELLSTNESITFEDLLGQKVTIWLDITDEEKRYFNGHISRFSQSSNQGSFSVYQATVVPWLWFLTRTSDCRIFQQKTVPDIIKEVFRGHGLTDFEEKLSGSYRSWEYCVQYRETDFNFVSRLMEQEGIYYYFKHEENKHTLVLSDGYSSHETIPGYESIPYFPPDDTVIRDEESISSWYISKQVQTGIYALNEYDFERPKANLKVSSTIDQEHSRSDFEIYDYPGEYVESADGDTYARTRIEELHTQYEQAQAESDARGILSGGLFSLSEYPREDQDREYLVVTAAHNIHSDDFESSSGGSGPIYANSFSVIDSQTIFRPSRSTPKPMVQGPQTAIVVGPSGEEIYTDEHGRVKLQFHWDRYGLSDENSSCWIRVSQVHAGKGFGGIDTPRIDEEVIVEFLEGDPDRPIITGRVYNGDNAPPNGLPGAKMVSGMKSNSTPGGGGDNTIMLDDTQGNEAITIHGQYNMNTTVDNDQTNTISNNRTSSIGVDDSETVGSNQTISIGVNQTSTIGSNRTVSVGANKSETVGANKTESIAVLKALSIGGAYQVSVGAAMNETVAGLKGEEIGGAKIVAVGGISSENVGANKSVNAGSNISETAGGNYSATSGGTMSLSAGGNLSATSKAKVIIDAASELILKCGGASIVMKSGGEILIKGTDITIKGSGKINAKAGGTMTLKGSKILQN